MIRLLTFSRSNYSLFACVSFPIFFAYIAVVFIEEFRFFFDSLSALFCFILFLPSSTFAFSFFYTLIATSHSFRIFTPYDVNHPCRARSCDNVGQSVRIPGTDSVSKSRKKSDGGAIQENYAILALRFEIMWSRSALEKAMTFRAHVPERYTQPGTPPSPPPTTRTFLGFGWVTSAGCATIS